MFGCCAAIKLHSQLFCNIRNDIACVAALIYLPEEVEVVGARLVEVVLTHHSVTLQLIYCIAAHVQFLEDGGGEKTTHMYSNLFTVTTMFVNKYRYIHIYMWYLKLASYVRTIQHKVMTTASMYMYFSIIRGYSNVWFGQLTEFHIRMHSRIYTHITDSLLSPPVGAHAYSGALLQ